jgi:hypothetical protein
MKTSGGWGRSVRKNRARAIRKPKVRWEVLGLQGPLGVSRVRSMKDVRQQALSLASSEFKLPTRSPAAEQKAQVTTHAPVEKRALLSETARKQSKFSGARKTPGESSARS